MIKILFITPTFRRGGAERITLNILNQLDYKIFDVSLIICVKQENELINHCKNKVKIIELNKTNVRSALPGIFRYIKKDEPDLVFTTFNHLSLPIILYKMTEKKTYKTIVRINSLPSNNLKTNWRSSFYGFFFSKVINNSDVVISQSKEMSNDILNYYNIDRTKISTIQNPVDAEHIYKLSQENSMVTFEQNYFNLIAIGSLSEVKGYDLLIKAMHELKMKRYTNYRLYIVGDNRDVKTNYRENLQELINNLELTDRIFLLGFQKNPYNLLRNSDAFILSSRKEGFPNVVLEALSIGKPCLVTNCVDFSSFITADKGLIIEKNSVEALVTGIIEIVKIKGNASDFTNFDYNHWFKKIHNK